MWPRLKTISEQVIVITGASSGIGLTTSRMAAMRGARVVLAARNEAALRKIVEEIRDKGGQAAHVAADVGKEAEVRKIADAAIETFGGFDSWVNNAAVAIFGKIEEVPVAEQRQLFEANYWGVVHGSIVAVAHLRARGGALINIGSVLSDRALPLQGPYSAAKHAVKGFTDALRMELEMDGAPISVTLIKPASIDTPYPDHAKSYMASKPKLPPPVYAPDVVADAILHAAQHPVRDLYVGGAAKALASMGGWAPRLSDVVMEQTAGQAQQSDRPVDDRPHDNLYEPSTDGSERGSGNRFVRGGSLYTRASLNPLAAAAVAVGLGATAALLRARRSLSRR
ncbi:SDR family oxidoreductase [Rhodospirillaceae bacterium SYSU D60014]|uniref:SDR family oxidoreductase n=1 Tax=Virgifigura deserti TaxID=2268457 RepID=UPI000E66B3CC